jgi:hypothetical protein
MLGNNVTLKQGGKGTANPKAPAPVDILADKTGKEDADGETDYCASPVEAEDDVFAWARAVDGAHELHAGWEESCCAEALEHEWVDGESGDEGPDCQPGQA